MDAHKEQLPEGPGTRQRWLPRLFLLALVAASGWLTFAFFDHDWQALTDERPVCSGRHALHLYHGYLGAKGFKKYYTTAVYDPNFYAGYVKTPWFDSGSRPAELFLALRGSGYHPGAYKVGLAVCWFAGPFLLGLAAWVFRATVGVRLVAIVLGMLVLQTDLARGRLWAGDLDLLLGGMFAPLVLACCWRFHAMPSVASWLGLVSATALLLFAHPFVLLGTAPAMIVLYLSASWRHDLKWHLSLMIGLLLSVAANGHWLLAAADYWWVWTGTDAVAAGAGALTGLLAAASLARAPLQLACMAALLGAGGMGLGLLRPGVAAEPRKRFGIVLAVFLAVAALGHHVPALAAHEPFRFVLVALCVACIPAAAMVMLPIQAAARLVSRAGVKPALAGVSAAVAVVVLAGSTTPTANSPSWDTALPLGLPSEARQTFDLLKEHTSADARILWEEDAASAAWTPLLPIHTQRFYLSGLSSHAAVEHAGVRLANGRLAGKPLGEWVSGELDFDLFCQRFNVGWVVCKEEATIRWLSSRPKDKLVAALPNGRCLYAIHRSTPVDGSNGSGYVLRGSGRVLRCDDRVLTLADLVPEGGQILLSLHYHPRITASSERVRIAKEADPHSSVPFLRLELPGPMTRLTLRWSE
jgi:hypothetical protein